MIPIQYLVVGMLVIIQFLGACSSSKTKSDNPRLLVHEHDDFPWINNEDFRPTSSDKFDEFNDFFQLLSKQDSKNDLLASESLGRLEDISSVSDLAEKDPLVELGMLCRTSKDFAKSEKIMDQLYRRFKSNPNYWNQVGSCYYYQGNYRKAILFYNKANSLGEKYAPAINNLGLIYVKENKFQQALVAFRQAADLNPFSLTPMFNLSQIYLKFGLLDEALEILTFLRKQNDQDLDVKSSMANLLFLRGEIEKSIDYFAQIDSKYYWRADIGINYALALKIMGKDKEAIKIIQGINTEKLGPLSGYYSRAKNYLY